MMTSNIFCANEKQFPIEEIFLFFKFRFTSRLGIYYVLLINLPKNVIEDKSPLSLVLICKSH